MGNTILVPPAIMPELRDWMEQHFGECSPYHPFVLNRMPRAAVARWGLGDGHGGDAGSYRVWIRDKADRALFNLRWSAELASVKP